jgi:hypothetical protein
MNNFAPIWFGLMSSGLPLQTLVAFAVITATFFYPFEPPISAICFIGMVLIEAGMHTRLTCRLT